MENRTPTIAVDHVCKAYRRGATTTRVLDGVSFSVRQGECVFLTGPSGSGKTTLLSILGCVLTPDEGRIEVLGADVAGLSAKHRTMLRRDSIGFVFQRFHLIRGLTAAENICVPLTLQGVGRRAAGRRAAELLEAVGLADKAASHPARLSVGQCQRVALARALAGDPQIILADEPTAALDAESGQEAMQLLRRLTSESGKTAVVVTHDQRILHFADRILELEDGTLCSASSDRTLGAPV